jgi:hypothetical protein
VKCELVMGHLEISAPIMDNIAVSNIEMS